MTFSLLTPTRSGNHGSQAVWAGTAASLDHIIVRLQILETADQVRNASDLPVVINVRSWVVHLVVGDPSNQRSGRPVAVSATGV